MIVVEKLPPAFERFNSVGGALKFAVFEDANADEEAQLHAIRSALPSKATFDPDKLRSLGSRAIDEREFFGEWYDAETGSLLVFGDIDTDRGELISPRLKDLEDVKQRSAVYHMPDHGTGGQFAYAFSWTPYGLSARPSEIQTLFEEIRDFILPPGHRGEIRDWTSPLLPEVSDYFAAGMEWWGVFLFTIYVPSKRQLTAIAGSTTD